VAGKGQLDGSRTIPLLDVAPSADQPGKSGGVRGATQDDVRCKLLLRQVNVSDAKQGLNRTRHRTTWDRCNDDIIIMRIVAFAGQNADEVLVQDAA
jgi:hypothetical protein